ncbi:MAG: MYG1 family protein, partial [Candidatus Lokiarchaeota archaeon]|nr:MYG1 family protein [Candidatus Lokiarchaeota archaeon]
MTIIITHPGSAHLDEFLSCCLVIYKFKDVKEIRRKEPLKSDINDPNIWVLDVGEKHDPNLKCFDHHQGNVEDSTLSLLLKNWNFWEKAKKVYRWLEVSVLLDARGPNEVYKFLNIDSNIASSLDSFVERTILHIFQEEEVINQKHILFSLMKKIGKYFFANIRDYFNVLKKVENKIKFKRIKDVLITICYKDLKHSSYIQFLMKEKRKEIYPKEKGGIFI